MPRPTLLPGLHRLWRGRRSLQLGVDPARAVVLDLPDPGVARLLDLLDGTRSERAVLSEAVTRYQIPEAAARALLDALCAAGLVIGAHSLVPHTLPEPVRRRLSNEAAALALRVGEMGRVGQMGRAGEVGRWPPATPAQILRRRSAARVVVTGYGQLAAPVAVTLARSGVGHVAPDGTELAELIRREAPGTGTGPLRRRETTFVVQVGTAGPAVLAAAGYARHRLAHLVVAVRDGTAVVGPLVPPRGSPCLNCVELHRQDRDPEWPALAAQLATEPPPAAAAAAAGSADVADEPCAAATVLAAAALAAGEVLSWLDGARAATVGACIELAAPGDLRRRSWPPHPRCHCFRGRQLSRDSAGHAGAGLRDGRRAQSGDG